MKIRNSDKQLYKTFKQKLHLKLELENPELKLPDKTVYMRDVLMGVCTFYNLGKAEYTNKSLLDRVVADGIFKDMGVVKDIITCNDEVELVKYGVRNKQLAFYGTLINSEDKMRNMRSLYDLGVLHESLYYFINWTAKMLMTSNDLDAQLKLTDEKVHSFNRAKLSMWKTNNIHMAVRSSLKVMTALWIMQELNCSIPLGKGLMSKDLSFEAMIGLIATDEIKDDLVAFIDGTLDLVEYNSKYIDELAGDNTAAIDFLEPFKNSNNRVVLGSVFLKDYALITEADNLGYTVDSAELTDNEELRSIVLEKYTEEEFKLLSLLRLGSWFGRNSYLAISGYTPEEMIGCIDYLRSNLQIKAESIERLQKTNTDINEKFKSIKSSGKTLLNEAKGKDKLISQLETRCNTLANKYKKLEQSKGDIESLNGELVKLKSDTEALRDDINTKTRIINKMTINMDRLNQENGLQGQRICELEKFISELKTSEKGSTVTHVKSSAIVNAIRGYKITVFGGNMMHAYLNNLGLENLKLVGAEERGVNTQDVVHQDVLVVVTGYISHSLSLAVKSVAKSYNIKLINFNGKNIDTLCKRIFNEIYGR